MFARVSIVAVFICTAHCSAFAVEPSPSALTINRDGGVLYPGEIKVITVPVNVPKPMRIISAKHGCGCMFSADIPSALQPAQDNILQIGLVAGDQIGDMRVGTTIEATDGERPVTIITNITASIRDPIHWFDQPSPPRFEFSAASDQDHQRMTVAFNQGEHPMRWQDARIEVVSGSEWLGAELATSDDRRVVTLSRRKTGYYGVLSGRFGIHLSDAKGKPLPYQPTYLIQAKVAGAHQARPAMAFFGAVHRAAGDTMKVRLRSSSGQRPEVEAVHIGVPGALTAEITEDLINVTLPAQVSLGSLRTHIDVCFRDGGILRIPVLAHMIE